MNTTLKNKYLLPVTKYRGKQENITFPCYASLKLDGELEYIVKQGDDVFLLNKPKYGRKRWGNMKVIEEFKALNRSDGVYIGELFWNEGRTKDDFHGFLRNKTNDELKMALWGIVQIGKRTKLSTTETYEILGTIQKECVACQYLSVAPFWKVENQEQLNTLIDEWIIKKGYEGLVIRTMDSIYVDGQTRSFIKIKTKHREATQKTKHKTIDKNGKEIKIILKNYGVWI